MSMLADDASKPVVWAFTPPFRAILIDKVPAVPRLRPNPIG